MEKCLVKLSGYSFYLGLFIELGIVILDKSAYTIRYEGLWFRGTFILFGFSLLCRIAGDYFSQGLQGLIGKEALKEWIWLVLFALIGVISYKSTGRNEILRFVVFIWACSGMNMKKVLKYTFWYTTSGCLVVILLSVTGIYGDIALTQVYRTDTPWVQGATETRYCFGMGHPNAFHCMMLALTWLGLYCYDEKMKWYGYILLGAAHIIVFLFTDSRTGLLMSLGSLVLIVVLHYGVRIRRSKWVYIGGIAVLIGTVIFSYYCAKYSTGHPLLARIDGLLSHRILNLYYDTVNHEGMLNTWSLWSEPGNTAFFDLGVVRFFYWFGIIPAIIYYLAQCHLIWCGYRNKDYMLLAVMVSISLYTVFEAHYVSDYLGRNYIFFFMGLYLMEMLGRNRKREKGDPDDISAINQRNHTGL